MKSRLMMSILVIALAAALIAGATSAWFTAEAELPEAEFVAGIVEISADKEPTFVSLTKNRHLNVNPGDCSTVTWEIVNDGTKAIELRVKLAKEWEYVDGVGILSTDNVYYAPAPESGWVIYQDPDGLWLYYTGGPVAGTFDMDNPGIPKNKTTVELPLIVAFDGPGTDNKYQGKWFELSGQVEAIQASNEAPDEVWGNAWKAVIADDYVPTGAALEYLEYIQGTPCWKGEKPTDPDPDKYDVIVTVQGDGSVSGDEGSFKEGDSVTLTATANAGSEFVGWVITEGLDEEDFDLTDPELSFNMPGNDVEVKAVFEEEEEPVATSITISGDNTISAKQHSTVTKQYTAVVKDQDGNEMTGADVSWSVSGVSGVSINQNGVLSVPSKKSGTVTITATSGTASNTYNVTIRYHS
jgi:predicted ribosomally synthesized peptide with SipW-like signal peptide